MNGQQSRLELFARNTQVIKKDFIWQNTLIKRLAALLYAAESKEMDCEAIHESHDLIKKHTGLFSAFRGNSVISIATMLSLSSDRNVQLSNTLEVYELLKKEHFRASDFLVVAAYQIAAHAKASDFEHIVRRAKAFYDGMKQEHWFLTGQDDYIFAAMLGLSDVELSAGLDRMEQLYDDLKPEFFSGIGLQSLAQVLVLSGKSAEAETRVLALRDTFRARGIRLDRTYTLSSLGVLSLLPADIEKIVREVDEAYEYLRTQKGFGAFTVSKQELLLLSAGLVAFDYVDHAKSGIVNTAISTSIVDIIIAQQAAIAAAAASSAAAAGASSSG
jgi:hypothetical protein